MFSEVLLVVRPVEIIQVLCLVLTLWRVCPASSANEGSKKEKRDLGNHKVQ